jgi:OOP family OmpA-OmpF porin
MLDYSDIQSVSNLTGRYLLARFDEADYVAFVAVAVGQTFSDVHVVEVTKMDTGMVTLDAGAMSKRLDAEGYVIVDGIYFDTDRATLKSESSAAIEQISMLLQSRSDLDVYVVGHTDTEGSLAHNQALSEAMAKAVVDELAEGYGVARDRMSGHGVGPLAPQATDSSDSGRAENRRVVLVAR